MTSPLGPAPLSSCHLCSHVQATQPANPNRTTESFVAQHRTHPPAQPAHNRMLNASSTAIAAWRGDRCGPNTEGCTTCTPITKMHPTSRSTVATSVRPAAVGSAGRRQRRGCSGASRGKAQPFAGRNAIYTANTPAGCCEAPRKQLVATSVLDAGLDGRFVGKP